MVSSDDVARMRAQLFFEGVDTRRRVTRFWLLLVLSAIIASAGVASDSTALAMIADSTSSSKNRVTNVRPSYN